MRLLITAVLFGLSAASGYADDFRPSISVTGEATAKLAPDQVTLPVTIQSENPQLTVAKQEHDKKLRTVLALAKEHGVPDTKMQTQYTQVSPQYDYPQPSHKPVFRSYVVSTSLSLTLPDTTKLAPLMNALTEQKIDRIGSVQFGLKEEKKAREELLAAAIQNAREKAEKMAAAAGVKVGKPLSIAENGSGMTPPPPRPMMMARAKMADAAMESAPDLPSGLIELQYNVSVSFALE